MSDLLRRIELQKIVAELGGDEADLDFLLSRTPQQLRELRGLITTAIFARHEERVRLIAGLSKRLPAALTAKIAESALGPVVSARIAGALDPKDAVKLTEHVSPEFLTRLAVALDPVRIGPIVAELPESLTVDVGRRLLAEGQLLVLGRFVSVVPTSTALAALDGAEPAALLEVALYADDADAVARVARALPEETRAALREAAEVAGPETVAALGELLAA